MKKLLNYIRKSIVERCDFKHEQNYDIFVANYDEYKYLTIDSDGRIFFWRLCPLYNKPQSEWSGSSQLYVGQCHVPRSSGFKTILKLV